MLIDLDYFFAQCEERRRPELKDKPIVVCVYSGRTEESGAVSTANYIARGLGVKSGMPIYVAKKKLQNTEAVFLPVDHDYYEAISDRIMNALRDFVNTFEQVSIDEAYLDITEETNGSYESAKKLAEEIRRTIPKTTGITCSVGIGPNKLIAKIASDENKPDGLTVVKPEDVEAYLKPLPISRLPGVGKKTEEKMMQMKVMTIGELAEQDITRLRQFFGEKSGDYFYHAARGIDDEAVHEKSEPNSISRIATLKLNTRELNDIMEKVKQLNTDVHSTLVQRGVTFRSVTVIAVLSDLTVHTRSTALEMSTSSLEVLESVALKLFEKLLRESQKDIRRVGIKVSAFDNTKHQKTLIEFS